MKDDRAAVRTNRQRTVVLRDQGLNEEADRLLGLSSVEAPTICLQARAYCSAPSSETPLVRKRMRRAQVKSVQEFRVISKTKTARFLLYSEKNWPFVSHIHWLVQYLSFRSFPTCRHHANAHGSISVRIGVQSIEHTSCILTPEVGVLRYFDVIPSLASIGKNKICSCAGPSELGICDGNQRNTIRRISNYRTRDGTGSGRSHAATACRMRRSAGFWRRRREARPMGKRNHWTKESGGVDGIHRSGSPHDRGGMRSGRRIL